LADNPIYRLTEAQLDFLNLPPESPVITLKQSGNIPNDTPVMVESFGQRLVCIFNEGEFKTPTRTLRNRSIRVLGEIVPLQEFKSDISNYS
jgi:hypothetical protein